MSVAAVGYELLGVVERLFCRIVFIHGEHGGELFVSELLAQLYTADLADEYLGALGYVHAAELGYLIRALTYYLSVQRAVDDDGLAYLVELVGL